MLEKGTVALLLDKGKPWVLTLLFKIHIILLIIRDKRIMGNFFLFIREINSINRGLVCSSKAAEYEPLNHTLFLGILTRNILFKNF